MKTMLCVVARCCACVCALLGFVYHSQQFGFFHTGGTLIRRLLSSADRLNFTRQLTTLWGHGTAQTTQHHARTHLFFFHSRTLYYWILLWSKCPGTPFSFSTPFSVDRYLENEHLLQKCQKDLRRKWTGRSSLKYYGKWKWNFYVYNM